MVSRQPVFADRRFIAFCTTFSALPNDVESQGRRQVGIMRTEKRCCRDTRRYAAYRPTE